MANISQLNNNPSFKNKVSSVLGKMKADDKNVTSVALISSDGIAVSSKLRSGIKAERFGALSASLLGLGDSFVKELARGKLNQVLLNGSDSTLLFIKVGKHHVLAIEADHDIKLGMLFHSTKKVADAIVSIIQMKS